MEKKKKSKKQNPILVLFVLVLLLILLFGTRAILYVRVLIGNDLVIKLNADNENIFLTHGESGKIKITSHAISNIFCNTNCTSKFIDLSSGQTLEEDIFNLKLPKTKEFTITATSPGEGQKLYRFDLECNSQKTFLCTTIGITKKRTLLLTVNYEPTKEEKTIKQDLSQNLSQDLGKLDYYASNLNEFSIITDKLNNTLEADDLITKISKTKNLVSLSNISSIRMINLWDKEDYFSLNNEFPNFKNSIIKIENEYNSLNNSINYNLGLYNSLIDNLNEIKNRLEDFKELNITGNSTDVLNDLINKFNNLTLGFLDKDSISNKQILVTNILNETQSFIPELSNLSHPTIKLNNITFNKIIRNQINFSYYDLKQPYPKCCYNHSCEKCCDNACVNNGEKYPIIFLHGHSFNQAVSAEESLDSFEEIQRALEKDNYLNAGSLYLSSSKDNITGVWGKINYPLTIRASYYFDLLTNEGKNVIIQTKTDNLDTYTLRLREIINEVKSKTNRQKVIIVSHSMGGLIARRYIQVFGEEDIDKLIFISVPNHGISGKAITVCPVFGTKLECNDMDKNSLFMNKLNNAPTPSIPIFNIIGIGCQTNGETGDGVVTNSSQYLGYAKNYYVNGTCKETEFTYLHTEILNLKENPETYGLIKSIMNNSNTKISI